MSNRPLMSPLPPDNPMLDMTFLHPALNPTMLANRLHNPKTEFSLEFLEFIIGWGTSASVGDTEFHHKWWDIATRKGCFPEKLVNELGQLTGRGYSIFEDAKLIDLPLRDYYHNRGQKRPSARPVNLHTTPLNSPEHTQVLQSCHTMTDLLPYGKIDVGSINLLKHLFLLKNFKEAVNKDVQEKYQRRERYEKYQELLAISSLAHKMPFERKFEEHNYIDPTTGDPAKCFLTSNIRLFPKDRPKLDKVLRLGFAEIIRLPRFAEQKGRGRAPIGVQISAAGERFFELYLDSFDEQVIKNRELEETAREMQTEKAREHLRKSDETQEPQTFGNPWDKFGQDAMGYQD